MGKGNLELGFEERVQTLQVEQKEKALWAQHGGSNGRSTFMQRYAAKCLIPISPHVVLM